MLLVFIFDVLDTNPLVKRMVWSWTKAQTCAAGFDFQEEGDQSILQMLVATARNLRSR